MADDVLVIDVIVEDALRLELAGTQVIDVNVPEPVAAVITIDGPRGPVGPAGDGGFTYVQSEASATWTIYHPLGRKPASVTVWIADELVETTVETSDVATVIITFAAPQSGRAEII